MTSCPQLTEGGQALPGRHFQKAWPVPQPVEGLLCAARSARARPGGWEAQRLGGPEAGCPSAGRRHPAPAPSFLLSAAFMNGPASQTADWLSRRTRGPISSRGAPGSAWGLGPRSREWLSPTSLRLPLPQGDREEAICFVFF